MLPAVGEPVHVLWDIGTQYGLSGEVTEVTYGIHIKLLVDNGFGRIVEEGEDEMRPFGYEPILNPMILSKGADFDLEILPRGAESFPPGTTARIDVLNSTGTTTLTTWTGDVRADIIRFSAQSADTDPIPAGSRYRLYVAFPYSPPRDVLWYYGPIQRKE